MSAGLRTRTPEGRARGRRRAPASRCRREVDRWRKTSEQDGAGDDRHHGGDGKPDPERRCRAACEPAFDDDGDAGGAQHQPNDPAQGQALADEGGGEDGVEQGGR
jgi:hypothetical protein